jgi:hypothetical protein
LPRAFLVAQAAGVKVMCWFSAQDSVDGPWGLLDNEGGKRKSYVAFRTLSKQLRDYSFARRCWGRRSRPRACRPCCSAERAITSW